MRHVFTDNNTIAELWATQAQNHARNKRHTFYFTGNTIYSYGEHFPIAIIEERFGRKFVLYNSRNYSRNGYIIVASRLLLGRCCAQVEGFLVPCALGGD